MWNQLGNESMCKDIGCVTVKPWCYWLSRLVISNWCVWIRLLSLIWNFAKPFTHSSKHSSLFTVSRGSSWKGTCFINTPCVNDRTIKIIAWKQAINWSSVVVVLFTINKISSNSMLASQANVVNSMDVPIKLLCIVSGNHSSIIYRIAFDWISTLESA